MMEIIYQFKLWRFQQAKSKNRREFARHRKPLEKLESEGKTVGMTGSRDSVDALHLQEGFANDILDNEISLLMTEYMVNQAQRYVVPIPDEGNKDWWTSDRLNNQYLTAAGVHKIRADIREEKK